MIVTPPSEAPSAQVNLICVLSVVAASVAKLVGASGTN